MQIYLHIGYPKTATTWLQKKFFPFVNDFAFVKREDILNELIHPYGLNFNPQKARDFFITRYGSKLILSLEGFLGTNFNFGVNGYLTKEHAHRLYAVFPEAVIIMFIRRQQDIIASAYYQYLVGGGTYSITKYLKDHSETRLSRLSLFSYPFFEYHYTISLYEQLFSKDRVNVYLYEEFKSDNNSFLEKFIKDNNFKLIQKEIDLGKETERYRAGVLKLSYLSNLFTAEKMLNKYYLVNLPYWFRLYKPVLARLNRFSIFGSRPDTLKILGKKNYDLINEYYKDSNRKLLYDFGMEQIRKYNYPL